MGFLKSKIDTIIHNPTVRNGALFTFFAFANNGINFILLIVLAKYISPGGYGQLNLFNVSLQLLGYIISLSTAGYIEVAFFKKDKEGFLRIVNSILIISTAVLLFFLIIVGICKSSFTNIIGLDAEYQWLIVFICYFQVFFNLNLSLWRLEEKPVPFGLFSMASVILNFIITLFLVICLNKGWVGRIYAQTGVSIVFFITSIIFIVKRGYFKRVLPQRSDFYASLIFGLPLIPHQAAFWARQCLDRFFINDFHSVEDVGLYSFAFNFASILIIIGNSFNNTNSVLIFKKLKEGYINSKAQLNRTISLMFLIFCAITALLVLGCSIFIPWAVPKYIGSVPYLLPLCLSSLFSCLYLLYVNFLFYYSKTKQLMYITLTVSVIQVLVTYLVTRFGTIYVAYANAFGSFLIFFVVFLYYKRLMRKVEISEIGTI